MKTISDGCSRSTYVALCVLITGSLGIVASQECYSNIPKLVQHKGVDSNTGRDTSGDKTPGDYLSAIDLESDQSAFVYDTAEAIDRIVHGWQNWPKDPKAYLNGYIAQSKLAGNVEKNKLASEVVDVFLEDTEKHFDNFRRYGEVKQGVVKAYLGWSDKKHKGLIDVVTKNGERGQFTEKYMLGMIDEIRKAQFKNDVGQETKHIVQFMLRMTPEQRRAYGKELTQFLSGLDSKKDEYAVTLALARGMEAYVSKWDAKGDWVKLKELVGNTVAYDKAYQDAFVERADLAKKRFEITKKYIQFKNGKYFKDKKYEPEFKKAFEDAKPDRVLALVGGLVKGDGHSNQYLDYSKRLAIAFSVTDGKGRQMMAVEGTMAKSDGGKAQKGAIQLAQTDEHGRIDPTEVERALKRWDQSTVMSITGRKVPRSHGYRFDSKANSIKAFEPEKGDVRVVWHLDGNDLKVDSITKDSGGKLQHGDYISFNDPPKFKPLPKSRSTPDDIAIPGKGLNPDEGVRPDYDSSERPRLFADLSRVGGKIRDRLRQSFEKLNRYMGKRLITFEDEPGTYHVKIGVGNTNGNFGLGGFSWGRNHKEGFANLSPRATHEDWIYSVAWHELGEALNYNHSGRPGTSIMSGMVARFKNVTEKAKQFYADKVRGTLLGFNKTHYTSYRLLGAASFPEK